MQHSYPRKRVRSPSRFIKRPIRHLLVLAALVLVYLAPTSQGQVRKNVLVINILGQSHPGPMIVTNLLLSALHSDPRFQAEVYLEDLDAIYHPEEWQEQLDSVAQQYRHRKRAAHAQVRIEAMDDLLHLSISDDGKGFDVYAKDGVERQGLGLWSMRERVHLVGGQFEIHSQTQKGTRIEVWAPLKKKVDVAQSESAAEPAGRTPIASGQRADWTDTYPGIKQRRA